MSLHYHENSQKKAAKYIESVDKDCEVHKEYGIHLDKLNRHGLLEPAVHSIPSYVHIDHFSDLLFEQKHKKLKRMYKGGNNFENWNLPLTFRKES